MRFKNLIFAFLCTAIISVGCDNATEPTSNGVIMPLTVGNSWDYKITASDSSNTGIEEELHSHTVNVVSDSIINNEKWYGVSDFFDDNDTTYFQNKTDGTWIFSGDTAALTFKYPAQSNTSYLIPYNQEFKVVSVSESVTVPKGTFICHHYRSEHVTSTRTTILDFYLAPNVGIVKIDRVTRRSNSGQLKTEKVLFELSNYTLK